MIFDWNKLRGFLMRRRYGSGPDAFGVIGEMTMDLDRHGARRTRVVIYGPSRRTSCGMYDGGKRRGEADLSKPAESAWVPVFVSRIRPVTRKRRPR